MKKFKTMKVFDCQDMPDDLCRIFLLTWDNKCNDVFVSWTIAGSTSESMSDEDKEIDAWLIANGATAPLASDQSGEAVIIQYWW